MDSDWDGVEDCFDECPVDRRKIEPGKNAMSKAHKHFQIDCVVKD